MMCPDCMRYVCRCAENEAEEAAMEAEVPGRKLYPCEWCGSHDCDMDCIPPNGDDIPF